MFEFENAVKLLSKAFDAVVKCTLFDIHVDCIF
jgi:hypothetical protein